MNCGSLQASAHVYASAGDALGLILSEHSELSRVGVADIATGKIVFEYIAPRVKFWNYQWSSKVIDRILSMATLLRLSRSDSEPS